MNLVRVAVVTGLLMSIGAWAQVPAGAPAGSTGLCKDGTYHSGATKSGACSGHKGVKDWYGSAEPKPAPSATPPPAPSTTATPIPTKAATPPTKTTMPTTAAVGGGPGQVWVNKKSKVYHCSSDKWYGKTKKGEYMTEAAAKAAGNHADHGKACA